MSEILSRSPRRVASSLRNRSEPCSLEGLLEEVVVPRTKIIS